MSEDHLCKEWRGIHSFTHSFIHQTGMKWQALWRPLGNLKLETQSLSLNGSSRGERYKLNLIRYGLNVTQDFLSHSATPWRPTPASKSPCSQGIPWDDREEESTTHRQQNFPINPFVKHLCSFPKLPVTSSHPQSRSSAFSLLPTLSRHLQPSLEKQYLISSIS